MAFLTAQPSLACAVAFFISEFVDFAVYTPPRERSWLPAVVASNTVGTLVDSALFLWLAFGSLTFLSGQVLGKLWMTALAVVLIMLWRRMVPQPAETHERLSS